VRFLTNNPKKIVGLDGYGLSVAEQVPLEVKPNPHNADYLNTKRDKMGHLFAPDEDGELPPEDGEKLPPDEGEEPPILGQDEQPA
jgi:3,4-dihydroxy 2-butanone 4-phosphate synthase/GTP cyclohydrolase II